MNHQYRAKPLPEPTAMAAAMSIDPDPPHYAELGDKGGTHPCRFVARCICGWQRPAGGEVPADIAQTWADEHNRFWETNGDRDG